MDKGLVSIIIVNYNGIEHLQKCFNSLKKLKYKQIETILVDNCSTDQSISYIKTKFPKTIIIKNNENLGFAEANNIGYQKSTGEYILLLNNDTVVEERLINELIPLFKMNIDIGAIQPKIYFMDKPGKLDSTGSYLTASGLLYHMGINRFDSKVYNYKRYIYSAKGACLFLKRKVLEKSLLNNKIFDENYFAYFEETDLCHRIWLSGYKVLFFPKLLIHHKMGATSSKIDINIIQYHSYKNRIATYIKNLSGKYLLRILLFHLVFIEIYSIYLLLRLKLRLFLAIQKAIMWNILKLRMLINSRNYVQNVIRKVSDESFWTYVYKNPNIAYYIHLESGLKDFKD